MFARHKMCHAAGKTENSILTWHSLISPSDHIAVKMVLFCVISPRLWESATVIKDTHTHSEMKSALKVLKLISSGLFMDPSESSQSALEVPSLLILCISIFAFSTFFFCFTVLNSSAQNSLCTNWFGYQNDSCSFSTSRWQMLAAKSGKWFIFPPRKMFFVIMDNTA